jgi:hypothetical protein
MSRNTLAESLLALVSLPVCAGIAGGCCLGLRWALLQVLPSWHPSHVLLCGVVTMWSVVLFGMLLAGVERFASAVRSQASDPLARHASRSAASRCRT